MPIRTALLCCALAHATAALAAQPQPESDLDRCRAITGNPDLAIRHCTRAIETGKLDARDLSHAYASRGVEKAAKNDFDGAIADFDAALRSDANLPEALYGRGIAWANKGEPAKAIADFDAVLKLNPKNADALQSRGTEWMISGDYKRAIEDFDAATAIDPKDPDTVFARGRALFYLGEHARAVEALAKAHQAQPGDYTALWLYLARRYGGSTEAAALLDRDTRETRDNNWPRAVISLYLDQSEPQRVVKLASSAPQARRAEQRCEALFYGAHWYVLRKAPASALPMLEDARKSCPKNILEYEGTLAALRQLKP